MRSDVVRADVIREIVEREGASSQGAHHRGIALSRRIASSVLALTLVMSLSSDALAGARVSLLGFEGDSATPLRWRVAQILKRAGHTLIGFKPRDPESAREMSAFAARRNVDMFIAGSAVESDGGWELTLTLRGPDGEERGAPLTFEAETLGGLVKELKASGQAQLDGAIEGRAGGATADESDGDDDDAPRPSAKQRKRNVGKARLARPARAARAAEADEPEEESEAEAEEPEALDADDPLLAPRRNKGRKASSRPKERASESSVDDESGDDESSARRASESATGSRDDESGGWGARGSDEEGEDADSDDEPEKKRSLFFSRSSDVSTSEEVGVDETSDEAGADASKAEWPTVVLGVNAGLVYRTLDYVDDLYSRLRAPTTNSWVYNLQAEIYPFAKPVKDRVALLLSYEAAFSGRVRDASLGAEFPVNFSELFGGLRFRQPLGNHEIGARAGIASMSAGLEDPDARARIPEIDYRVVRASADFGLNFGPVSLRAGGGYRQPLGGFGQASEEEWFPRMEAAGVEGFAGLHYRFSEDVGFDGSAMVRRYVLQMNSRPEDAREGVSEVAGGAVDMYMSWYFGLTFTL